MTFQFDRAAHTYTLDGQRVPSVTDVLGLITDFSGIPQWRLQNARDRGDAVHGAISAFNRGAMDAGGPADEPLAGFIDGWSRFLLDTGAVVVASEQPLFHSKLRYAGTPDCVLSWGRRIVIPDIKATYEVPRTVGPQTAGYSEMYHDRFGRRPERYCVHLRGDGAYELHPRKDPNDIAIFLSCLNLYRWMEKST